MDRRQGTQQREHERSSRRKRPGEVPLWDPGTILQISQLAGKDSLANAADTLTAGPNRNGTTFEGPSMTFSVAMLCDLTVKQRNQGLPPGRGLDIGSAHDIAGG